MKNTDFLMQNANETIDDLLQKIGAVAVVADIGAGTGQLARLFADKCEIIYAVEPNADMREVAKSTLAHSNIAIIEGTAERTTLGKKVLI